MKLKKNVKLTSITLIEITILIILWANYKILTYDLRGTFTISTVIAANMIKHCVSRGRD